MTPAAVAAIKDLAASYTTWPLYWPNEPFQPPKPPSPFIWSELRTLPSEIRSTGTPGAHWIRDHGFVRFHLQVPKGQGLDDAYTQAAALAGLYRIQNTANVQTLAPSAPDGGQGSDDGNWFVVSFSVPFYFDYQG